jgi:hypothetical protein
MTPNAEGLRLKRNKIPLNNASAGIEYSSLTVDKPYLWFTNTRTFGNQNTTSTPTNNPPQNSIMFDKVSLFLIDISDYFIMLLCG